MKRRRMLTPASDFHDALVAFLPIAMERDDVRAMFNVFITEAVRLHHAAISQAIEAAEKERDEARSKLAGTLTVLRVIRESPHSDFVSEWAEAAVEEAVATPSRGTREDCRAEAPEPVLYRCPWCFENKPAEHFKEHWNVQYLCSGKPYHTPTCIGCEPKDSGGER
jgi:hypothetical protein